MPHWENPRTPAVRCNPFRLFIFPHTLHAMRIGRAWRASAEDLMAARRSRLGSGRCDTARSPIPAHTLPLHPSIAFTGTRSRGAGLASGLWGVGGEGSSLENTIVTNYGNTSVDKPCNFWVSPCYVAVVLYVATIVACRSLQFGTAPRTGRVSDPWSTHHVSEPFGNMAMDSRADVQCRDLVGLDEGYSFRSVVSRRGKQRRWFPRLSI